ncbi:maestro heat-like repeat-containing protein family member 7 [Aptenodytes patagonicus]|uniref:maestro heat-like repeat-containing protein family member 7 n=1 Tax=Aptenodytes patagonicus TaxID=9234 RepID=UPI003FA1867E
MTLLLCADVGTEEFAALYKAQRYLRHPSPVMLSLVLRGLITLSETPETARKIPVLLPDIMETLQDANADVKMKALVLLRNMMGHMKREEASVIALQLAEKLLPLFDDVSSQVRELSISFFEDVMKTVIESVVKVPRDVTQEHSFNASLLNKKSSIISETTLQIVPGYCYRVLSLYFTRLKNPRSLCLSTEASNHILADVL